MALPGTTHLSEDGEALTKPSFRNVPAKSDPEVKAQVFMKDVRTMHHHQRQFIISPTPLKAYMDWKSETVRGVGFLSHCPKLPVCKVVAQDGSESILIGIAVQTDPSRPSPVEELKNPPAIVAEEICAELVPPATWLVKPPPMVE